MNNPTEKIVRPVKCYFCNAPMFYSSDTRHEPEVMVSTFSSGSVIADTHFYAHVRCWNAKIEAPTSAPSASVAPSGPLRSE